VRWYWSLYHKVRWYWSMHHKVKRYWSLYYKVNWYLYHCQGDVHSAPLLQCVQWDSTLCHCHIINMFDLSGHIIPDDPQGGRLLLRNEECSEYHPELHLLCTGGLLLVPAPWLELTKCGHLLQKPRSKETNLVLHTSSAASNPHTTPDRFLCAGPGMHEPCSPSPVFCDSAHTQRAHTSFPTHVIPFALSSKTYFDFMAWVQCHPG